MGRKIVSYLIEKAAKIGMTRVFVLTTRTIDWFEQLGFVEADLASLPARKSGDLRPRAQEPDFALELKDRKPIKS
jgi:amino-acid N-acetyltransferase